MLASDPQEIVRRALTEHFGSPVEYVGIAPDPFHLVAPGMEFRVGNTQRQMVATFRPTTRVSDLVGWMAVSALQWKSLAKHQGLKRPVLLVGVDRVGAKTAAAIEVFMKAALPGWEWGVFDLNGSARIRVPSLRTNVNLQTVPVRGDVPARRSKDLFSDLNQWMLKVLLLRPVKPERWAGPRDAVGTATDLARVAKVSIETAHRFVRTFEERDFLRRTASGLRIVRAEELLDSWLAAERLAPRRPVPVAWYPERPASMADAFPRSSSARAIVGGFEACRRMGLLHASTDVLEIHVLGSWEREMPAWSVERCEAEQANLFLVPSLNPTSVERGSVAGNDLATVDILQAALDVVHSTARGAEQARFLNDHILAAQPKGA
jgi:hypothetical protein